MTPQEQFMAPPGVAEAATADAISQWGKLQAFLADPNNLLLVFLFAMGVMMKRSHRVKNEDIVWILPCVGFMLGAILFSFVTHQTHWVIGGMQGGIYGALAIFAHQIIRQKMPSVELILNGANDEEPTPPPQVPPSIPKP